MKKSKFLIYTGPVRVGKTCCLASWSRNNVYTGGVLAPVIGERRHIMNVADGETKLLEYHMLSQESISPAPVINREKLINIGNFMFFENTFSWARNILNNAWLDKSYANIIIDEIGPLELSGRGLAPTVDTIISTRNDSDKRIILVVRDYMLEEIFTHYGIAPCEAEILRHGQSQISDAF